METNRFIAEINSLIARKIRIIDMKGEPQYAGKEGYVTSVDDAGQIHGTWGGCALVEEDEWELVPTDPKHYQDDKIDVRVIDEFKCVVFVSSEGRSTTVRYENDKLSPADLIDAYLEVFKEHWSEGASEHLTFYANYLYECMNMKKEESNNA
jgi:hypothetical protein